jgi:hypothetical protein
MAKGSKTGGGSRKGVPNKLTADVKEMILGALDAAGGLDYLTRQAKKNPTAFLSLLGRVLPRQIEANVQGTFTGYEPVPIPVAQRESDPMAAPAGPPSHSYQ